MEHLSISSDSRSHSDLKCKKMCLLSRPQWSCVRLTGFTNQSMTHSCTSSQRSSKTTIPTHRERKSYAKTRNHMAADDKHRTETVPPGWFAMETSRNSRSIPERCMHAHAHAQLWPSESPGRNTACIFTALSVSIHQEKKIDRLSCRGCRNLLANTISERITRNRVHANRQQGRRSELHEARKESDPEESLG